MTGGIHALTLLLKGDSRLVAAIFVSFDGVPDKNEEQRVTLHA
jgi:hypothetical protein